MSRLAEMMQRVRDLFKPYTFEDYVKDYNPQTHHELEQLERSFQQFAHNEKFVEYSH